MTDKTALPVVGPRSAAVAARIQGADAYAAGVPALACPYAATRPLSRAAWLFGYSRAEQADGYDLAAVDAVDEAAPYPLAAPEPEQ